MTLRELILSYNFEKGADKGGYVLYTKIEKPLYMHILLKDDEISYVEYNNALVMENETLYDTTDDELEKLLIDFWGETSK